MPGQPSGGNENAPAFVRRSRNNENLGVHLRQDGPVYRLEAASLERPLEMPRDDFRRVLSIAGIAAAIALIVIIAYNTTIIADRQEVAQQVEEVINRDVTLDLPSMRDCAGRSNEDILGTFYASGFTIFDNTSEEDTNANGFDVYKLAPDVTVEEAQAAYARGLENVSPPEAARILSGSWRFLMSRSGETEMRLRYIDFAAVTPNTAINDAMSIQQFDTEGAGEITQDSMGNSNLSGTFEKDGATYNYTISVCDLSQVYDIDGLPSSAQYVGIRVTS